MKNSPQQFGRLLRRGSRRTPDYWRQEWVSRGEPWRTHAEISFQRQTELRRMSGLNGVELTRADVEWLLHILPSGPLMDAHRGRDDDIPLRGLRLCGADLRHQDLSALPLAETDFTMALLSGASLRPPRVGDRNTF
jgi:hypothetical protein